MAATPEQLQQMEAAYYSGEKSVSYNGRTVTYHDLPALWQAILNARADLAASVSPRPAGGVRRFRFTTHRGF